MSVAGDRSEVLARAHSPERSNRMEFAGSQGSFAGATGLLVVPGPNYLDFDVDLDDDDEEVVIGIRPKSSPQPRRKTSVSEEESDISEPPSSSGSRRVSFADAVGLNLVQVKEFDKWDLPQLPNVLDDANADDNEYFISPVNFPLSLPSEKIFAKVLDQKVGLESVELLAGTTILKGVIHVLNISFTKAVYVRTSLDNWVSHFDLLSEYVPGSSGGHLDRFAFRLTLVPPFAEQGARVDFCLRYETPNGTFWDNNSNKNYVLFCHKRKEVQDKQQKESVNKKSCLKSVSRSFFVEESMSSPEQENLAADLTAQQKSINETQHNQSDNSPVKSEEDANTLQVENRRNRSRRNRRKAARMAQVRDHFSQKDLTIQDSDTQASSEKHIPTAPQQNQTTKYSNPKGSVQLEDSANGSLSKDSNSKTHENFNLPDAATLANDRHDESEDVPNEATELLQNTNNFVSTSEAASPEAASYCGRPSVERDDSERLVSDSSGFPFGTVVAPLYQEVSRRGVGSQSCREMYNSRSTKEQQETEAWRSSADRNVCECVCCCCSDGKVESCEQSGATSSTGETPKVDNAFEKGIKIQEVQTNTISDPVHPIDGLDCIVVNASEQILNHKKAIQNCDLSLECQETFSKESFQTRLLENDNSNCLKMKSDETILKTQDQDCQFEKRPCRSGNITDLDRPGLEKSTTNLALPPSNVMFQEENTSLSFELSQNETARPCDNTIGAGLEIVDKTLDISSKDFKYEENVSSPFQPSQNEDLVDQSASVNDMMVFPSLDIEACNIIVSSHVFKTVTENSQLFTNSPTKTVDESSLEFEDQTRAVSPKQVSETPADADKSLSFEQTLAESLSNRPTNTSDLISEQSPDSCTSILTVSPISEEENAQLGSQLLQNVDRSLFDHNESIVFEDQRMAFSPTCTFETPEKENPFLLVEQKKSLVDKHNETSDLTGENSLDGEGPQIKATNLSMDESIVDVTTDDACGILDGGNVMLLREQNEDLENKSRTEHNNSTKITPRQGLDENVEENACWLLERNIYLQDPSTNRGNLLDNKYDCEAVSVAVASSLASELLGGNPNVSLQPSQSDELSHPDELNIEHDEKILTTSSNLEISGGETVSLSKQLPQNEGLPDQPDNCGDSVIHLELDHKLSETVDILPCQESAVEPLPLKVSKRSSIGLVDQPSHANSLLAQSGLAQDLTKTADVFEKEDTKCNTNLEFAGYEVVAHSGLCFEKLEVTKSCEAIEQKETSRRNEEELTESIHIGSDEDAVEAKTNVYCDEPARISRSGNVRKFELLSQIETMAITLEDCVKTWEVMVDEEQEHLSIQDTNQDIVDVATNLAENDKLESLDSKLDDVELSEMAGSQRIASEYAKEHVDKKESKLEELDSVAQVDDETCFAPAFEDGIPSLCTSYEEIVKDCASVSSNASVNEKQMSECVGSKIMDAMDNMPGCEDTDVEEMEKVKTQLTTNEEERFKIPPRRVKSKLFAPVGNVQEGIQSVPDKIVEETTYMPIEIDKTDLFCCSKDTNDDTFAGDLKCDQNSDDDGRSESESGSEDEMELYMHCLRAVYGQRSSPKATKPAQNRDEGFKRVNATRSKRMSTSLPSISESFDEEQATDIMNVQEKEIETVQAIAQAWPDSGLKEDEYLWWKQSFSCRNILKSLLYATLGVIFLAVAYHYDFIACFGLYMMSLIWLFFQGDGQTGKNKS